MKEKPTVSKKNAEMFNTFFGPSQNENITVVDQKKSAINSLVNDGGQPPLLKATQSIFNYIVHFFTIIIPTGAVFSYLMKTDSPRLIDILKIFGISVGGYCVVKCVEFFISFFMILRYSKQLNKLVAENTDLENKLKNEMKKEDDAVPQENVPESVKEAFDFVKIANSIVEYAYKNNINDVANVDTVIFRQAVCAIYYNILANELVTKVHNPNYIGDIVDGKLFPQELFKRTENIGKDILISALTIIEHCIDDSGRKLRVKVE